MNGELISVTTFCSLHHVNEDFISALSREGMVRITQNDQGIFIGEEELQQLEVYTRWHELGINLEGMEALAHLVQKVRQLQSEVNTLRARVRWQEEENSGMEI